VRPGGPQWDLRRCPPYPADESGDLRDVEDVCKKIAQVREPTKEEGALDLGFTALVSFEPICRSRRECRDTIFELWFARRVQGSWRDGMVIEVGHGSVALWRQYSNTGRLKKNVLIIWFKCEDGWHYASVSFDEWDRNDLARLLDALRVAYRLLLSVGTISVEEADAIIDRWVEPIKELARYLVPRVKKELGLV